MNDRMIRNSGCLLLCGGKSRRMGTDKAGLTINGRSFLDILAEKLRRTGLPCYLSLTACRQEIPDGFTAVYDELRNEHGGSVGPMGGLYAALNQAAEDGLDGLYVVSVDAPLFETKLFERLSDGEHVPADIRVFCGMSQRLEPLFGYYRTGVRKQIEELAASRDYKLYRLLNHPMVKTSVVPITDQSEETMLSNINDLEAYAAVLKSLAGGKKHLFLQGQRSSGKTTLIRTILAQYDLSLGGFATKAVRDQTTGVREIRMYPASFLKQEKDQTATHHGVCAGCADNGIRSVRTDVFDSYGTELLKEAEEAQLIVMDELGTMETGAHRFTEAVLHALDQDVPVLGALKTAEKSSDFLERVRTHPDVEVIELTMKNRHEAAVRVQKWLTETLRKKGNDGDLHET